MVTGRVPAGAMRFGPATAFFAGFAGGAAEVGTVGMYALLTGADGWSVTTGVSEATFGAQFDGAHAVLAGLAVHFGLSFLIAACFVPLVPSLLRRIGQAGVVFAAVTALIAVWVLNFFVVLPRIAPEFVAIVPLWLSFLSKLSFGAALGVVPVSRLHRARPSAFDLAVT